MPLLLSIFVKNTTSPVLTGSKNLPMYYFSPGSRGWVRRSFMFRSDSNKKHLNLLLSVTSFVATAYLPISMNWRQIYENAKPHSVVAFGGINLTGTMP